MSKKYQKKQTRSRKIPSHSRGKCMNATVDEGHLDVQLSLPLLDVLSGAQGALERLAGDLGIMALEALLQDEVDALIGRRHAHSKERTGYRWGSEESHVVFAGRKVSIARPRVRSKDGAELPLERYRLFSAPERMEDSVAGRVLNRVATRRYEAVLDEFCDGYGIQKSSVSDRWKAASAKQLKAMMERSLADLDLGVVMIDGFHYHKFTLITALGVDHAGKKHILGLWQGATENATIVGELLDNLIERGLSPERNYLFVLDGSKALRKAVTLRFGDNAIIQRCTIHKERNILDHLPEEYKSGAKLRYRAALGMKDHKEAKKALLQVERYLRDLSPSAADSLLEAFDELLTLHRLNVGATLRKSLQTTNLIENAIGTGKDLTRNVKRWRNASMAGRWAGAVLLEAEKKFRRVRGYKEMNRLMAELDRLVDRKKGVA